MPRPGPAPGRMTVPESDWLPLRQGRLTGLRRTGRAPVKPLWDLGACYVGAVATHVIVLNGGSISGKSGIARCLQAVLPDPWLVFGVDTLIQAMPVSAQTSAAGIEFAADGAVVAGREIARGDRVTGMAGSQAELVHQGVAYDLQVDTTHTEALDCARAIAACVR
jgi:chloramphenicol 3-O-phosphotransferase